MLALALLLLSAAVQDERPPLPSSAHLPADRLLIALEVAGWPVLDANRSRIVQLAAFEQEKVRRLTDWLTENQPDFVTLRTLLVRLAEVGARFDEGMTAASIFPLPREGQTRASPATSFIGAAKAPGPLRELDARLEQILLGDQKPEGVAVTQAALADSPVQVRTIRREQDYGNGYGQITGLAAAVKGRLMAIKACAAWGQAEDREQQASRFADDIGELLGLTRGPAGGAKLGTLPPLVPGDTFLGRFVLRFHANAADPTRMREREQQDVKKLWFWGWQGVECQLVADPRGVLRERIEFRRLPGEERVFLDCFRDGERGIGDLASHLPADTLGVMRVGLDLDKCTQWAYGLEGFEQLKREEISEFLGYLRKVGGLDPRSQALGQDPTLRGFEDFALVILPGAAGSPAPELAVFVRSQPRPDQGPDALHTIIDLMRPLTSGESIRKLEVRPSGEGDSIIHTLRLKDLFAGDSSASAVSTGLLGGGFLSTTRVGPYFVLGCNPRTLRHVHEKVASGATLATHADFAAHFPAGTGRALEAWIDLPRLATQMKAIDALVLLLLGVSDGGATLKLPPMPSIKDIAPALSIETLRSEKADSGWVVDHQGGTLLSPVAWAAFGYGAALIDDLQRLTR